MYKLILIVLCFVRSEACLTYNFEDGYRDDFTNQRGLCRGQAKWNLRNYSDIGISSPHELSTQYISPNTILSCVASFTFQLIARGTIEINVYMETSYTNDQMSIMANEVRGDNDATVAHGMLGPGITPNFVPGWHTLRLTLTGSGTYTGYITMLGIAAADSTVLVDSFRYIPPNYEGDCNIYEHELTSTTFYTTPGEWSTTPEITTPGEWSTTPEITTPGEWSTTPEITTPGEWSTTPEITTPGELSTTPEITTPGELSTTPEITTPGELSTTPEITTPGEFSTTPEITTPGEWSTTPEITTPGELSTTPGEWSTTPEITTPGEWSTTPEITTPGEWSTTPEITTPGEWSTTPEITTPGEWSTTPEITTPGEWSTTPEITTPGEWSTTPEITTPGESTTTTEETTTTPTITTTDQLSTTEDFISVETTTIYTTMASEPEDTDPTQNTEITTESTIPPTSKPVVPDFYSFWNPYTISMVILLILIFITIVAGVSYYFGLRKGRKKEPIILSDFIDDLPKSMIIPRVDKISNNSILTR